MHRTVDTSVTVAAFLSWHERHAMARTAVLSGIVGVPAHVLAETYSVLTRLPAGHRVSADAAMAYLEALPGEVLTRPAAHYRPTLRDLAHRGITLRQSR